VTEEVTVVDPLRMSRDGDGHEGSGGEAAGVAQGPEELAWCGADVEDPPGGVHTVEPREPVISDVVRQADVELDPERRRDVHRAGGADHLSLGELCAEGVGDQPEAGRHVAVDLGWRYLGACGHCGPPGCGAGAGVGG